MIDFGSDKKVTVSRMDPYSGYKCIGNIAYGAIHTDLNEYACVKDEYVTEGDDGDGFKLKQVWKDDRPLYKYAPIWEKMDKHSVWTDAADDKSIASMKTFLSVANYDKPPPPFYHLTQQTELFVEWIEINDKYYHFSKEKTIFSRAQSICLSNGGKLFEPKTESDNNE